MEPKLRYISFFKKLEFIESQRERFPSFRQPLLNIQLDSLPAKGSIAMSIAIEHIELQKNYFLQILIKNPDGATIHEASGPISITINETPMFPPNALIVFEPDELHFDREGIYSVEVLLDRISLGIHTFGVCKKVLKQ